MTRWTHVDDNPHLLSWRQQIATDSRLQPMTEVVDTVEDLLRQSATRSHEAAAMIMHEHQATGRPFVLYLRSFESEAYEYFDKPGPSGDPTTMWTAQHGATSCERMLAAGLATRVPLLGVANPADLTSRAVIPRLQVASDGWQGLVRNLIEHAAFIVMECDALAQGVIFELETIVAAGRTEATIVVLPAAGADDGPLRDVARILGAEVAKREPPSRNDPRLAPFPRRAAEDEIDFAHLDGSPLFAELLADAVAKASAAPAFDPKSYATNLNNLGVEHHERKEYGEALSYLQQAILVRRHIDDRSGLLTTLTNLGSVLADAGAPEQSVPYLTEAHGLAQELHRTADEGLLAGYLGAANRLLGDLPAAIRWLTAALPNLEGDGLKNALVLLTNAYLESGDREQAMVCARRFEALGTP